MSMRSAKVPESPSSALQQTNFTSAVAVRTVSHLMPAGKPAPPRPRRPEVVTSATTCSGARERARPARQAPVLAVCREVGRLVTPTRAKLTRCWRASHGWSSTTPMRSSPSTSPPSSRRRPRRGRLGDVAYPTRPSSVSTSTSGSSHSIPREPLRRTVIPAAQRGPRRPRRRRRRWPRCRTHPYGAHACPPGGESLDALGAQGCRADDRRSCRTGPERAVAQTEDLADLDVAGASEKRSAVAAYNACAPTAWQASPRHRLTVWRGAGECAGSRDRS
jgi:hypothetical protein